MNNAKSTFPHLDESNKLLLKAMTKVSVNNQIDPRILASSCRDLNGEKGSKKKPAQKPSKGDCLKALDDLNTLLNANEPTDQPRRLHKNRTFVNSNGELYPDDKITKGIKIRYHHLRKDQQRLYDNKPTGKNSYAGHRNEYQRVRTALKQTMDLIDGDCKDEINKWLEQQTPEVRAKYEELMEEGRKWQRIDAPTKPDRVLDRERPQEPTPQPGPSPTPSSDIPTLSPPSIDPWWIITPVTGGAMLLWRMIFPIEGQGTSIQGSLPEVKPLNTALEQDANNKMARNSWQENQELREQYHLVLSMYSSDKTPTGSIDLAKMLRELGEQEFDLQVTHDILGTYLEDRGILGQAQELQISQILNRSNQLQGDEFAAMGGASHELSL